MRRTPSDFTSGHGCVRMLCDCLTFSASSGAASATLTGTHRDDRSIPHRFLPGAEKVSGTFLLQNLSAEGRYGNKKVPDTFSAPNPSVVVREELPDGSQVEVIWAWMGDSGRARLLTVFSRMERKCLNGVKKVSGGCNAADTRWKLKSMSSTRRTTLSSPVWNLPPFVGWTKLHARLKREISATSRRLDVSLRPSVNEATRAERDCDARLLTVLRYVQRNPLRARLVKRAEDCRWGSAWRRHQGTSKQKKPLATWPLLVYANDAVGGVRLSVHVTGSYPDQVAAGGQVGRQRAAPDMRRYFRPG